MNTTLLMTITGEITQPARVYYDLFDKDKAIKLLSKLRCIDIDKPRGRWVWLYTDEAKRIKLKKSYSEIPKKLRPIILGSLFFKRENEMFLEVRSFERATEGILFFDKYIDRSIAKVRDIIVINRLFSVEEANINFDVLFEEKKVVTKNPDEIISKFEPLKKEKSTSEKIRQAWSLMMEEAKEQFPEVERFPVHFYEDGIDSLKYSLVMRQNIALEHWKGNKDYNFLDLLKGILKDK